jgi:CubicO group peptidase (beta-lactamase class C family)
VSLVKIGQSQAKNPQSALREKPAPPLTQPANSGFIGQTTPVPENGLPMLETNSHNVGEDHTSPATPTVKAWSVARFPYNIIAGSASTTPLTELGSSKLGVAVLSRLERHLAKFPVTGLLVLHDDQILLEKYRTGHGPSELFHGFSMSKTVLATLIGIALDEGRIRSIQDKAAQYVPELAGTLFGENTIKDLLQMSSGEPDHDKSCIWAGF